MDPEDYLRASEIIVESLPVLEESDKRRAGVPNLAKLSYKEIVYQKNNQILVAELREPEKNYSLNAFNSIKEIHEKGVNKFKQTNSYEDSLLPRQRRRGNSIDSQTIGSYYLNNWISGDEYTCEKPSPEEKTAHLVYQILGSQWAKALDTVCSLEQSMEISTLTFVLKGFKAMEMIIAEESQLFEGQFLNRDKYEISFRSSSESVGGTGNFVSVFEEDSKTKFLELRSLPRKVECLKMNLDYLTTFASRYEVTQSDDYIKLAFYILSNSMDQDDTVSDPLKDFSKILIKLNLKIYDRLNFATKLLPEKKRKAFCSELEQALTTFPCLDNILFYLNSPPKVREDKIEQICRAYLDQYGDLETIAYLSIELPFLTKYYRQFRQILEFADHFKEIERIDNYRWGENTEGLKDSIESRRNKKIISFFEFLSIPEEKMAEPKIAKEIGNICEICSKKIQKNQNFLECGKCRHGGHPSHLLKWFQESQNCPHIGCPCVCN